MKSLSKLRETLDAPEPIDEIALKTATSAYKKRLDRGELKKAIKTGDHVLRKIKKELQEETTNPWSLPAVLVLHRKSIRNFSDGTAVALYYNDKLKKYFSVPVLPTAIQTPIQMSESVSIIDRLFSIKENDEMESITLNNNEVVEVIPEDASNLLEIYEILSEENKIWFTENISESSAAFNKILKFSLDSAC